MPRSRSSRRTSSSSGGSRSWFSSKSTPSPPKKQPPPPSSKQQPPPPASVPAPQQRSQGLGSTIMEGFAFGTGSSIARHAVGALFGGGSSQPDSSASTPSSTAPQQLPQQQQQQQMQRDDVSMPSKDSPCYVDHTRFKECMEENNQNVSSCEFYFQALQQCQSSNHAY